MNPQETLKSVLSHLFETWAMMFSDEQADIYQINQEQVMHAHISFQGTHQGSLDLWVTDNFSENLVANVVGLIDSSGIGIEERRDVAGELANLTCGHFLSTYFGKELEFNLGIPEVRLNEVPPPDMAQKINLNVDGMQIVANITIS